MKHFHDCASVKRTFTASSCRRIIKLMNSCTENMEAYCYPVMSFPFDIGVQKKNTSKYLFEKFNG